jgi:hypothetical protein
MGTKVGLIRRTEAAQIYKKTGNLRPVQLGLGHTKLESTVRYLGIEVDDALSISEQVELQIKPGGRPCLWRGRCGSELALPLHRPSR